MSTYLTSVASGVADGGQTTRDSPTLTVSGTNKVMYALVGNSDSSPADPSGVAWDPTGVNQALTKLASVTFATFANATLWRLIAPSNVTNGIVRATWAAQKGERMVCVWVETGVDQTTPNGTVVNPSGTGTAVSAGAVSTTAGQRILNFAFALKTSIFTSATPFGSPSGTERFDTVTSGTRYDGIAGQEQTAAGSSVTPTWTLAETPDGWASFAFALNVAGATTTRANPMSGRGGSAAQPL